MDKFRHDFLAYLSAEQGVSPNTLLAYASDLDEFFTFCQSKHLTLEAVELSHLRLYLAGLRRRDLAQRTLARRVSALKQFFKFMVRENELPSDPTELLSVHIRSARLPKHLTVDEALRLIRAPKGDTERSIRDRAMLELWYGVGCRISELAGIKISDLDWNEKTVKLCGKGGKQRLLPIPTEAFQWCEKYKELRHGWLLRFDLTDTETFFLTQRGTGFTRQGMWKLLKGYAKAAKIDRNIWPHMLRHSFATHVLRGGGDLRAVQALLGHSSIATTEVYTHLDPENLKVMQLKYHPRG